MKDYHNSYFVKNFPGHETVDARITEVAYQSGELVIKAKYSKKLGNGRTNSEREVEVPFDGDDIADVLNGFKVQKPEQIKKGKKVQVILQHQHGVGLRI